MTRFILLLSLLFVMGCEQEGVETSQVKVAPSTQKLNQSTQTTNLNNQSVPSNGPSLSPNTSQSPTPAPTLPSSTPKPTPSNTTSVERLTHSNISIPVLYYHSIANVPENTAVLHPDRFVEQVEYLVQQGYQVLSLNDFFKILENKMPSPPKPVLLTFDDGYIDNYTTVMPLLKKYNMPATLFLSTGLVETERYLNWDQVKELAKAGWDIQPHSITHSRLYMLSPEKQYEEIMESRRVIEENLGTVADVYCYPYGEFNQTTLNILKQNNFRYAFTIMYGRTTPDQDPLQLRRVFVSGADKLSDFIRRLNHK